MALWRREDFLAEQRTLHAALLLVVMTIPE